jgi:hypothetical protein
MDELGIGADGIDLRAKLFELIIPLCQSGEFGSSDECEVGGIKEENGPFLLLFLVGKAHLAEIALRGLECFHLEVGYFLPYLNAETAEVFHDASSSVLGVNEDFPLSVFYTNSE